MKLMTPIYEENIRKIVAAGDVAALGVDQSIGPAAHREVELLVAVGLTPAQVIRIATHNGAVFLGKADIDNTKAMALVIMGGRIIDESTLSLSVGTVEKRYAGS